MCLWRPPTAHHSRSISCAAHRVNLQAATVSAGWTHTERRAVRKGLRSVGFWGANVVYISGRVARVLSVNRIAASRQYAANGLSVHGDYWIRAPPSSQSAPSRNFRVHPAAPSQSIYTYKTNRTWLKGKLYIYHMYVYPSSAFVICVNWRRVKTILMRVFLFSLMYIFFITIPLCRRSLFGHTKWPSTRLVTHQHTHTHLLHP